MLEFLSYSINNKNLLASDEICSIDAAMLETIVKDKSCVSSIISLNAVILPHSLPVLSILEASQY